MSELGYECYFYENSWKIIYQDQIKLISTNNFYGYPFYVVFENLEIICKQFAVIINQNNISLSYFFPIELILKDMIDHKQNYWLNLGIDFIIKMNYFNTSIAEMLLATKQDKGVTQKLRNKVKRLLRINNYEY